MSIEKNRQLSIHRMETTGEKIKNFVETVIPDKKDYKAKLGQSYNGMHKYFTNQRKPGFFVLKRLHSLGMDINALLETSENESIK